MEPITGFRRNTYKIAPRDSGEFRRYLIEILKNISETILTERNKKYNMKKLNCIQRKEEGMALLDLENFTGGALQEKVDAAMKEVLDNMQDLNTPWKTNREIHIKISFAQNEDRDDVAVGVSVKTKTAPATPILTRMAIGKDLRSGKLYANEYGKQIKGQMSLNLDQPESGTIKSVDENKAIDFRKAAFGAGR